MVAVCVSDCRPSRRKRFLLQRDVITQGFPYPTPTTYPVPTISIENQDAPLVPMIIARVIGPQTVLTGSSLTRAVHVPCPVKRSSDFQRVLLDDKLMKELYLELVGDIDQEFVAMDEYEAATNFKHIDPIKTKLNNGQNTIFKNRSTFIQDIKTFSSWFDSIREFLQDQFANDREISLWKQRQETEQLSDILESSGITKQELEKKLQLSNTIEEVMQYRYHGNRRIKRNAHSQSRVEYCTPRGNKTGTEYLHMCTTCALTTQLADNLFPRFINEATCDQSDCNCFTGGGTSHGRCQPIIRNIKVLQKSTNGCRMVINDGTKLIVDDWVLYDQPVHVGCECMLNKNSQFAVFIPKH
ncbi:hypothetical protein ACF0H5_009288 [Mactra antiquata]